MRSSSYGEYYEDCFIIKLNEPIDFEDVGKSDDAKHLGTFFHEYLHFLQNISTTFGNFSMAVFYAKMNEILYQMANNPSSEMSKVIHYNDSIEPYINRQDIALGDMDDWTYEPCSFLEIENVEFVKDSILEELGYGDYVTPQVRLLFIRKNVTVESARKAEHKTLHFGAMCIMESMADMMDLHLYGRSKAGEFVQYDICKKMWQYFFGGIISHGNNSNSSRLNENYQNRLIFRCCEYSLMFDNPGQMYYTALFMLSEKLKNGLIERVSEAEIDDFFQNCIKPNFMCNYESYYSEMVRFAEYLFPSNSSFTQNVSEYIMNCFECFHKIRKVNPLYFTKIYEEEPKEAKCLLIACAYKAMPLVVNSLNETFMHNQLRNEGVGLEMYAAYYAIYSMFTKNQNSCELLDLCKINAEEGSIKNFCSNEPLKSADETKVCALGQVLHMWQSKVRRITQ